MAPELEPGWARVVPWGIALVALGIYGVTLAPGLTWQHDGADGGDLVSAAYTMGVAHPPGYPTYLLLGKVFSLLPWGNVAFRLNLMSAAFASGAVLLSYWSTSRLGKAAGASPGLALAAAAVAALGLATSSILWSQALIAEVYTLHLFFVSAIALCLLRWRDAPLSWRWLWLAAFLGGLGLGNHLTLVLVLLPAFVWVLWGHRIPRRMALGGGLSFLLGLSVLLYLPWRAAQGPPINWGNAHTWSGFWWLLSASPYRDYVFGLPWEQLPQRMSALASLVGAQFQWWGLLLALVGLRFLWQKDRPWALFSAAAGLLAAVYATMYNTTDSYVYLMPLVLVLSWWLGMGVLQLMAWRARRGSSAPGGLVALNIGLLLLIPGVNVARSYSSLDLSHSREAEAYAQGVWQATEPDALILVGRDTTIFPLWYYNVVEAPATGRTIVAYPLLQYPWYQEQLARSHPGLLPATPPLSYQSALEAIVQANLGQRPIYMAEDPADVLPGYGAAAMGGVWRLRPP